MSREVGLGLPPGWSASALGEIANINPSLDRCVVNDDMGGDLSFRCVRWRLKEAD